MKIKLVPFPKPGLTKTETLNHYLGSECDDCIRTRFYVLLLCAAIVVIDAGVSVVKFIGWIF